MGCEYAACRSQDLARTRTRGLFGDDGQGAQRLVSCSAWPSDRRVRQGHRAGVRCRRGRPFAVRRGSLVRAVARAHRPARTGKPRDAGVSGNARADARADGLRGDARPPRRVCAPRDAERREPPRALEQGRRPRGHHQLHQHRGDLSFGGSARCRCGARDAQLPRPVLPEGGARVDERSSRCPGRASERAGTGQKKAPRCCTATVS